MCMAVSGRLWFRGFLTCGCSATLFIHVGMLPNGHSCLRSNEYQSKVKNCR